MNLKQIEQHIKRHNIEIIYKQGNDFSYATSTDNVITIVLHHMYSSKISLLHEYYHCRQYQRLGFHYFLKNGKNGIIESKAEEFTIRACKRLHINYNKRKQIIYQNWSQKEAPDRRRDVRYSKAFEILHKKKYI